MLPGKVAMLITRRVGDRTDDERRADDLRWSPAGWARVEVDPWEPMFEKAHRLLVPLADVNDVLHWRAPAFVRWLELAREADARRR